MDEAARREDDAPPLVYDTVCKMLLALAIALPVVWAMHGELTAENCKFPTLMIAFLGTQYHVRRFMRYRRRVSGA